jgi:hypothetical protein
MPGRRFGIYSQEFELAAVRRVLAGEKIGQVRFLLDNFDGDALEIGRTAGRVRSAWARSSSSRIARN